MIRTYFIAPGFAAEIDTAIKGISIAGEDRTFDIKLDGTSIEQVLTSQEDNCRFVVKSGDKPTVGQEIIISDSITRFAGIIDMVQDDPISPDTTFYKCQARDYTYQLDKKLVVEVYENTAPDVIVLDILSKYCTDFTGINVQTGGPTVELIAFDYDRPSEAMKKICQYVGWDWYVDYDKDVHFFSPVTLNKQAPITIRSNSNIRNYRHDIDTQGLRNRVYILGGKFLSDPQTFEYVADGKQRLWVLGHEPHSPSVEVAGVAETIGLENVDDEVSYDYMYNQREKYIRCSTSTTTPIDGATVAFTYKVPMDVISMVEDLDSQTAVAVVQGGDGIYEHKIIDDTLITVEAAEAAGQADLKEFGNPTVKGSFETEIDGWAPGQLLDIYWPDRGVIGTYIIQRVTLLPLDANQWTFKIEYGGRLLGIADFLRSMVSAQQNKKLAEVKYQSKFVIGDEKIAVLDETTITPRTDPWYCGDADAICGDIICLAV